MDFNVNGAVFSQFIIHQIHPKSPEGDYGSVTLSSNQIELSEQVLSTLKSRITQALSTGSRSFECAIADISPGTFYDFATRLWSNPPEEFINTSCLIAQRLAESQKRTNIHGGYLVIIKGTLSSHPFSLVIKAELQEALIERRSHGKTSIELLENIFLSPANKLYKIGLIHHIPNSSINTAGPNQDNCCLLFDDNSNVIGEPAEYFYKDFLGFDPSSDARLKTKLFYNRLKGFIDNEVSDLGLKNNLYLAVEALFNADSTSQINPEDFRDRYFPEGPEKDNFSTKVLIHFPRPFIKDSSLIEKSIGKKKITFGKIKVEGPTDEFNERIRVLNHEEILELKPKELDGFTFIMIHGFPHGN